MSCLFSILPLLTSVLNWYVLVYHPGEGNDTPLQHSCLENPMDRGAWWAAVHGVAKSQTRLSDFTFTFHFHALEKEIATHSSVLAWRIPGTGEPGGLAVYGVARSRTQLKRFKQQQCIIHNVILQMWGYVGKQRRSLEVELLGQGQGRACTETAKFYQIGLKWYYQFDWILSIEGFAFYWKHLLAC